MGGAPRVVHRPPSHLAARRTSSLNELVQRSPIHRYTLYKLCNTPLPPPPPLPPSPSLPLAHFEPGAATFDYQLVV
eukprot:scaffold83230_cov62-Phaeocystis_antarctica.AAC.5